MSWPWSSATRRAWPLVRLCNRARRSASDRAHRTASDVLQARATAMWLDGSGISSPPGSSRRRPCARAAARCDRDSRTTLPRRRCQPVRRSRGPVAALPVAARRAAPCPLDRSRGDVARPAQQIKDVGVQTRVPREGPSAAPSAGRRTRARPCSDCFAQRRAPHRSEKRADGHVRGAEHALLFEGVETLAAGALDDAAEEQVVRIAVGERRARLSTSSGCNRRQEVAPWSDLGRRPTVSPPPSG